MDEVDLHAFLSVYVPAFVDLSDVLEWPTFVDGFVRSQPVLIDG